MLPKALLPFFLSFALSGGLLAFPGTVLDTLLEAFGFTPTLFGIALFVQGAFAFLGTRLFSKASLKSASLHTLEGQALLLPAAGIALVYLCDPLFALLGWPSLPPAARLLGYAALGAGVGGSGILNNAFALRRADTTRALGFLNMAFTAGAVAVPALTSALLARVLHVTTHPFLQAHAWRLPVAALFCCYLMLAAVCFHLARSAHAAHAESPAALPPRSGAVPPEAPTETRSQPRTPRAFHARFPLLASCLLLFCYVGSEVGMSVTWVPFLVREAGLHEAFARAASPTYWGGLFLARLTFALFPPPLRHLPNYLAVFGLGVLVCLGIALVGTPPSPSSAAMSSTGALSPTAWLALAGLSGAFIGASYSFVLAFLTSVYAGLEASRAAFTAAQCGVVGAVILPPAMGATIDATSFAGGMGFVFVIMVAFTLTALALVVSLAKRPQGALE